MNEKNEKIQKFLAQRGLTSRREAERWVQEGRLEVNGQIAHVGQRVSERDRIALDGRVITQKAPQHTVFLCYHKNTGEVTSHHDPHCPNTVFDRLPPCPQGRWVAVGRLDIMTSGLLVFTNQGHWADVLMHPRHAFERHYHVRVQGTVSDSVLERLRSGVREGGEHLSCASVERLSKSSANNMWLHVVLKEGKNRAIRRMMAAVGLSITQLVRRAYGPFVLPEGLPSGQAKQLDFKTTEAILALLRAKTDPPKA